jgi:hypothetical protein
MNQSEESTGTDAPFTISEKNAKHFIATDPYNGNVVEGILNMSPGNGFGNMIIEKVNGVECKQYIVATPKIHYPFDNNEYFVVDPLKTSRVIAYTKLDGTNILMFKYHDANGKEYISYKTRRMPFIGDDFKPMWDMCLSMYPEIPELRERNGMNISFELFGQMNKHGISYDVKIDTRVLFGRSDDGRIHPPCELDCGTVDSAALVSEWSGECDYRSEYAAQEKWLTDQFKLIDDDGNEIVTNEPAKYDQGYSAKGMEGTIWYVNWNNGNWTMFKCKSEQTKEKHFAVAAGISAMVVNQALFKVLEAGEELTVDAVKAMLREDEWSEADVERRTHMITRMIDAYVAEKKIRTLLYEEYDRMHAEDPSFDINTDKKKVMTYMAGRMYEWGLSRRYASKIYSQLKLRYGEA